METTKHQRTKRKMKIKKDKVAIKQATAQSLLYILKENITFLEEQAKMCNVMIGDLWDASIPTDPKTEYAFKLLNETKTTKRILAKRINKLAGISKELKEYLK